MLPFVLLAVVIGVAAVVQGGLNREVGQRFGLATSVTINSLVAADRVLIPSETEYLSSKGIRLLLNTIEKIQAGLNPELEVFGVLPTKYNQRYTHDQTVLTGVQAGMADRGIHVFEPIARSTAFSKASIEGKATVLATPDAPGVESYYKLADEIISYGL